MLHAMDENRTIALDDGDVSMVDASPARGAFGKTPGRAFSLPADSPSSPATTGSVWRALEELTRKHDAAVSREESLRAALTAAQKAASSGGAEEKEKELQASAQRTAAAEAAAASLRVQLAEAQKSAGVAEDAQAALRAELAQAKAGALQACKADAEAAALRALVAQLGAQLESAQADARALRAHHAAQPVPGPTVSAAALQAELAGELRCAQARAEAAEAQAKGLEGALKQYEATLTTTISAHSSATLEAAGRVGLLEAQNSRLGAEYGELLGKFQALTERYQEYKAKYNVAVQNEQRWQERLREVDAGQRDASQQLRAAGEEAVRVTRPRCARAHDDPL